MTFQRESSHRDEAEAEIYLSFIDSLFADRRGMLVGLVLQVGISACVYLESRLMVMGAWPAVFVLIAGYRYFHIVSYARERDRAAEPDEAARLAWAQRWERRYIVSSGGAGLAVGLFAWCSLELVGSEFAIILALSMVFAALPTIVGRLYGSVRLAAVLTVLSIGAPAASLASNRDVQSTIVLVLLLPYVSLVLSMVSRVRSTVVAAVRGRLEKAELANRFDIALTNMSHGVIMFNRDERVVVFNRRARVLLQIPQYVRIEGRCFGTLMRYAQRYRLVPTDVEAGFRETISRLLHDSSDKAEVRLSNGVHIEYSGTRRPEGGSVLILEDVTERARAQERIKAMARLDSLTELPNRTHFADMAVRRAAEADPDAQCLLIAFDVDDFKRINDSIGHAQGDALLRAIGRRLKRDYAEDAMIARLGGDEFMLFVDALPQGTTPGAFAERLKACLGKSFRIGPEKVFITQSFGIATGRAGDFDLKTAMVEADLALYQSKAQGKGAWSVFEPDMNVRYLRRQLLKGELAKAIEQGALAVRYQPIVEAETGRVVACEALSRWQHPQHGNISPAEYIPLAEEMGIITRLTEQVIFSAARDCATWPDHITVSVNLSSIDFQQDDICHTIQAALDAAGLAPERLVAEITETAVISNEAEMIERLTRIRDTGVGIALDDFGTGYSSLSYLHRLPLDRVKIDRLFVAGIETGETPMALLHGIIDLCHGLGLKITVEGVEKPGQMAIVRRSGKIDKVQGFLFGPALPASAIAEMATRMPASAGEPASDAPQVAAGASS